MSKAISNLGPFACFLKDFIIASTSSYCGKAILFGWITSVFTWIP